MGERKTVPQESKLLEPGADAISGYALDLKNLRHFEPAGGVEGNYRIALYTYGSAEATFWTYPSRETFVLAMDNLYQVTGWKRPNSVKQPSTQW
jgi:hypothetical protein